jgi:hypothetical protein
MRIANVEFNEITKGLYLSEDNKGLVIEIFDLTGLDKNTDLSDVSVEVISKIEDLMSAYAETIEGIVFDNRNYWELNFEDFVLDIESLCNMFPNLQTVACGGGEFSVTDYPDDLRLMSGRDFCDLARTAYRNEDLEKAEYYYQWSEITDFYDCMHTFGVWLSEKGKYEEAEELYKKIAGEKDKYGAVNNSYALLLNELGRQEEAQKYFNYVLHRRSHEDAQEFADVFLYDQLQDEDSPYWRNLCLEELNNRIRDYAEACGENGKTPNIEKILLNALESEEDRAVDAAKHKLLQIYGMGKYAFEYGDVICVPEFPDCEKFKEIASTIYESELIRSLYLDFIEDSQFERVGELSDDEIVTFEAALLAIDDFQEILFWLYYNGEYESLELGTVEIPQLINMYKAADLLANKDVWFSILDYGDLFDDYEYDEKRLKLLEEAHVIHPENTYIACELLMYLIGINVDRFVEVLKGATRECTAELLLQHSEYLFDKCNDIEVAGDLEKYVLSLIESCSEFGIDDFCYLDDCKCLMLDLYESGYSEYLDNEYPALINSEKATAFAEKYGFEPSRYEDEDEDETKNSNT